MKENVKAVFIAGVMKDLPSSVFRIKMAKKMLEFRRKYHLKII